MRNIQIALHTRGARCTHLKAWHRFITQLALLLLRMISIFVLKRQTLQGKLCRKSDFIGVERFSQSHRKCAGGTYKRCYTVRWFCVLVKQEYLAMKLHLWISKGQLLMQLACSWSRRLCLGAACRERRANFGEHQACEQEHCTDQDG